MGRAALRFAPRCRRIAPLSTAAATWLTPGLIDCHTHLVYAGNRAHEFERRQLGATYADIAREGGGIAATVRATRAASEAELAAQSRPRLAALAAGGVTTVEVKSGYGLDTAAEMKQLRVARALGSELDVTVRTTLLAAHALPPEFAGRADDYIDYVCRDIIPAVARAGLADAVDAYCETIAFTAAQTQRVFAAARAHGLPVKLHADQLSDMDGARARGRSFRAVRRSPRIHERRGRGSDGEGGHGRRSPARRVLRAARDAVAAGRGVPARSACRWRSPPTATRGRRRRRRSC